DPGREGRRLIVPGRVLTAVAVAASLVLGFAVAEATDARWLGGVVLVAGGVACAVVLIRTSGVVPTVVVGLAYLGGFVLSHPLGRLIGAWVAVAIVAMAVGTLTYAVMGPGAKRVSTTSDPTRSTR